MPCKATTSTGEPCQAPSQRDSDFCFHHDPSQAPARAEARKRGGRHSHGLQMDPDSIPDIQITSVADVLELLSVAATDILLSKPSLSRARAICYLSTACLKALETGELEGRIVALEARSTK